MKERIERQPLKVLMTTDTAGGVWSYSVELCKALRLHNVHFYLVTTGSPLQLSQKMEIEHLENITVYEREFLCEWMDSPWQSIDESGKWLLQLADKLQVDLVHLNCFAYGSLPWKIPVMVAAHSDVFSWWLAVRGTYPPKEWNEYFKRVHTGLRNADFIIASSRAAMNDIRKTYSAIAPGRVIYNGRSSEIFHPAQKKPFIYSSGSISDEAKNIRLLVETAKRVPYEVRLAGDTSIDSGSGERAGLNIKCLGKLSEKEMALELSAASIYVLPAKYEPFSLPVLAAALSGCVLVLGKINSLKEIWKDSAMYVDTNDAGKLANTINFLVENHEARFYYAQRARERAKNFTASAMAFSYMQVYTKLLQSNKQLAYAQNFYK
ncbi:MAG: glycosyltransferase [Ferruginibacter sp.]